MKKVFVCIISLLMLASMIVPMSAAGKNELLVAYDKAKDGDLLYEVLFGQTEGCYKSAEISRDAASSAELSVSADGRAATVKVSTYPSKRFWYGGIVDGLELGGSNKYTITYTLSNDNSDSSITTGNNGFFFNTDPAAMTYDSSFGSYGNLSKDLPDAFISLFRGGSKTAGEKISDGTNYIKVNSALGIDPGKDADGFVDYTIEIDGWKYSLYINGQLFDITTIPEADQIAAPSFAIIFYTYSSGGTLKNVNIYKGNTITNPPAAAPAATAAPATTAAPTTTAAPAAKADTTAPAATAAPTTTAAPAAAPATADMTIVYAMAAMLLVISVAFAAKKARSK